MSLLDFLFGGGSQDQKQTQTGETTSNIIKDTGTQSATATSKSTDAEAKTQQRATQAGQASLFTPEQSKILDTILGRAAGTTNIYGPESASAASGGGATYDLLQDALTKFGGDTDKLVSQAKGAATLSYNEGEGANISQYADQVGSTGNSTVQLLQQKGQRDLATTLGAVEADTRLKSRDQFTALGATTADAAAKYGESARAYEGGGANALADAIQALTLAKGGKVTTTGDTLTSGVSSNLGIENDIVQALLEQADIATQTDNSKTKNTGSVNRSASLLDFVNAFSPIVAPGRRSAIA